MNHKDPSARTRELARRLFGPAAVGEDEFEIAFLEGVLERHPGYVEVLATLGHLYTRAGRIREGLALDRRLVGLRPADAVARYNLACSLALAGIPDRALEELEEAAALGYADAEHMLKDADLASLRKHPRFLALIRRLRRTSGG